jgi:6-carboxyhexanoate--CoA ligase
MIATGLFSVRMHASAGRRHLSGAERIVPFPVVAAVVLRFLDRAWSKGVAPDQIVLTIEPLAEHALPLICSLDLNDLAVQGVDGCRDAASNVLRAAGVAREALRQAFSWLDRGPSENGGPMRGAMIMDALTGDRLEPDRSRGIRASRFDWSDDAFLRLCEELARLGLTHFRTREALALASKIASAPGYVAELCWSDDPGYQAGYVASRASGYVRLHHMKAPGGLSGGRAVFIEGHQADIKALTAYLELQPVVIGSIGRCCRANEAAVAVTAS